MATKPKKVKKPLEEDCPITKDDNEIILGILDTYHDFCKSERLTTAARKKRAESKASESEASESESESEDESENKSDDKSENQSDNEDESDPTRIEVMREYLPKLLKQTLPRKIPDGEDYKQNIKTLTCSYVKSVSDIEHKGVEMFESSPLFRDVLNADPEAKDFLTFEKIVNDYKAGVDKTTMLLKKYELGSEIRVLTLSRGGYRFGKGKLPAAEEKKVIEYLSDFILHFFFGDTDKEYYMTFDAGERIIGDIFHDRENVKCVIFPQTLADSATTSLTMLGARNEYVFPSTTDNVKFKSNLFSQNSPAKYNIYFKNKNFSEANKYGFSLVIENDTEKTKKLILPFSAKQNQGPSVNYLIDILARAKENAKKTKNTEKKDYSNIVKKGTILNLGEVLDKNDGFRLTFEEQVKATTNGIIPDLKRGGDHEAVLAAKQMKSIEDGKYKKFIFCTIDILCALKSRLEENNTIWQGKDKIILYRYPIQTDRDEDFKKYVKTGREIYNLLTKINTFQTFTTATLKTQLGVQKKIFEEYGTIAVVDYADRVKEPYYKTACEEALNGLLRIANIDAAEYCQELIDNQTFGFGATTVDVKKLGEAFEVFFTYNPAEAALKTSLKAALVKEGKTAIYTFKGTAYNLETTKKELIQNYKQLTEKIKEKLNIDYFSGYEDAPVFEEHLLKQTVPLVKPVTKERVDKSGNINIVFLLDEHPVFEYSPATYEKLYDHLMFIHDLHEKSQGKTSRESERIMRKIISNDPTAPFLFYDTAYDILSQLHMERYRMELAKILDIRTVISETKVKADGELLRKNMEGYKDGKLLTKDQQEELLKKYFVGGKEEEKTRDPFRLENGIVDNLTNYYVSLIEQRNEAIIQRQVAKKNNRALPNIRALPELNTLTYEGPSEVVEGPAPKTAKKVKQGGAGEFSIYQYYDLNALLYRISSTAAAFIESAYADEFPSYVLFKKFTDFQKNGSIPATPENKAKLKVLLDEYMALAQEEHEKGDDSVVKLFMEEDLEQEKRQGIKFERIKRQYTTVSLAIDTDFPKALIEMEKGFKYLCKYEKIGTNARQEDIIEIKFPTLFDFFDKLQHNDKYLVNDIDYDLIARAEEGADLNEKAREAYAEQKRVGQIVYEEISDVYRAALYEFQQNIDYIYDYDVGARGFSVEELLLYLLTLEPMTTLSSLEYEVNNENNESNAGSVSSNNENNESNAGSVYTPESKNEEESREINCETADKFFVRSYLKDDIFFSQPKGYKSVVTTFREIRQSAFTNELKSINKPFCYLFNQKIKAPEEIILFVLTLLENIMTPKKQSLFLKQVVTKQYKSKQEWRDNLYNDIKNIMGMLSSTLKTKDNTEAISIELALRSGGSGMFPKKNRRKQRSHARKSKKYNKTRKQTKY